MKPNPQKVVVKLLERCQYSSSRWSWDWRGSHPLPIQRPHTSTLLCVTFTLALSFRASSLSSLCVPPMTRQALLCGGVENSPGVSGLDTVFPGGWWWREIAASAGLHFAVTGTLPSALTSSQLYTCQRSVPSLICVYTCRSLRASSFPAFLWSHGRQREQVRVIRSCNFHVFTFSPASPLLLIPLAPASCAAFSHFATSSPSPLLLCLHGLPPHPSRLLFPMKSPCHCCAVLSLLPPVSQLRDHVLWLCYVVWVSFPYLILFFQLHLGT